MVDKDKRELIVMNKISYKLQVPVSGLGMMKQNKNRKKETTIKKMYSQCSSNVTEDTVPRWLQVMIPGCTREDAAYIERMFYSRN